MVSKAALLDFSRGAVVPDDHIFFEAVFITIGTY